MNRCSHADCQCDNFIAHQWQQSRCVTCNHTHQSPVPPVAADPSSDPTSASVTSSAGSAQSSASPESVTRSRTTSQFRRPMTSAVVSPPLAHRLSTDAEHVPAVTLLPTPATSDAAAALTAIEELSHTLRAASSSRASIQDILAAATSPSPTPVTQQQISGSPPTAARERATTTFVTPSRPPPARPISGSVSVAPTSEASDSLQKRFESEFNKRQALEDQMKAINKQIAVDRKETNQLKEKLTSTEASHATQARTIQDQAAQIAQLTKQVGELHADKAILVTEKMALMEQVDSNLNATAADSSTPSNASSSPTSQVAQLTARCRELEQLLAHERAERESLEIQLEALDFRTNGQADTSSLTTSEGIDTMVEKRPYQHRLTAIYQGLHPNRPSYVREIPDDLVGFDTNNTIRLKPGSESAKAQPNFNSPTHSNSPATRSSVASSIAASTPTNSSSGSSSSSNFIRVEEVDTSKILAAFIDKYKWTSPTHIEYFKQEIEEMLEEQRDEEDVREKLKTLESQEIQALPYELTGKLGTGGFGAVYSAVALTSSTSSTSPSIRPVTSIRIPDMTKSVAIKVINLEDSDDDLSLITREISAITEGNSCEQITHYYHSQVLGTKLFIVMELMDGGSVADCIKRKRELQEKEMSGLDLSQLVASVSSGGDYGIDEKYIAIVLREVLLGLQFLESKQKIHRDVKCANILLSASTGAVKLADLGASRQLTNTLTKANTFVGSPYWMAPEIMAREAYDIKCDIWSLGISAIEMATGQPPHFGMHPIQLLQLIMASPPPQLEGERFSKPFKEFVAICCVKNPEQRPTISMLLKHPFIKKAKPIASMKELFKELTPKHK